VTKARNRTFQASGTGTHLSSQGLGEFHVTLAPRTPIAGARSSRRWDPGASPAARSLDRRRVPLRSEPVPRRCWRILGGGGGAANSLHSAPAPAQNDNTVHSCWAEWRPGLLRVHVCMMGLWPVDQTCINVRLGLETATLAGVNSILNRLDRRCRTRSGKKIYSSSRKREFFSC
jgi:hypothetical protein